MCVYLQLLQASTSVSVSPESRRSSKARTYNATHPWQRYDEDDRDYCFTL